MLAMSQPQQYLSQVCMNGHKITEHFGRNDSDGKDYCPQCGKPTLVDCPECHADMLGCKHYPNVIGGCQNLDVPDFCPACGNPYPWGKKEEAKFLAADFGNADASNLVIGEDVKAVIQDRLKEAGNGLRANMPMSVVFSCGSAVEGMLFAYATANQELYCRASSAPQLPIAKWHLEILINVAKEVGHIGEDTKLFAQPLKGFRNYIHPREQVKAGFKPTLHTAQICYQVTKSVINDLEQV